MTSVVVSAAVLVTCVLGLGAFALYPPLLWLAARRHPRPAPPEAGDLPTVTMLVAVRNGQDLIAAKIRNALELDYPPDRLDVVVFSDGSTDGTEAIMRRHEGPRVTCLASPDHVGKAEALNRGALACRGAVLVLSDADALPEPGSLRALVRHFQDPRVGGVCGQRVIAGRTRALKGPQRLYVRLDSAVKAIESRLGRITSNDGKLYAIRRELFTPVPEAVTDDLFQSLNVVRQGFDFLFEPEARALIRLPSRTPRHEVERRRRIVSRSLRGIASMRALLDPRRYGVFSIGLLVNKVLRRLVPVCLILLLASSAVLSFVHPAAAVLLAAQLAFYAAALAYPIVRTVTGGVVERAASVPFYTCVGFYGTLLGLAELASGRRISRWDPRKSDP